MTAPVRDDIFDKPMVYEEPGAVIYRASSLGACPAALVKARLGVSGATPPDLILERMQEGTDWEERVLLMALEAEGLTRANVGVDWSPVYEAFDIVQHESGMQIETEIAWGPDTNRKIVRCHPDAIAIKANHIEVEYVVEVKFLGDSLYEETIKGLGKSGLAGLKPTYRWQAAVEMHSTGLPMLYVVARKVVKGSGEEREVTGATDVKCYYSAIAPHSLLDIKMRVLEIEGYVARGDMPDCPQPFMYPCPFWADHEKPERVELEDDTLAHLIESYDRAVTKKGLVEGEIQHIRDDIAVRLGELGKTAGVCGGYTITTTEPRPGNVSWSKWSKAVIKKFPEAADIDTDEFRGDPVAGGIRLTKEKKD